MRGNHEGGFMPEKVFKGRKKRGKVIEKKDYTVVGRIRGYGKIMLVADRQSFCTISGKDTRLTLRAQSKTIHCHPAFIDRGIEKLRQMFQGTTASA